MTVVVAAGRPRRCSLNGGKITQAVKCRKCVLAWRHNVEIYNDNNCRRQKVLGLWRGQSGHEAVWCLLFFFWRWPVRVYWLRCCICKTNRSLWPQRLWSYCHHLLGCVPAFIHACLEVFIQADLQCLPKDTSAGALCLLLHAFAVTYLECLVRLHHCSPPAALNSNNHDFSVRQVSDGQC